MSDSSFLPTWESLQTYQCPEWFRDAKFGIWAHWGPQGVPMVGDWYARNMYVEDHPDYRHHCRIYGHPSEVGYKDIVKLWKAEKFDAAKLVELYKSIGAKYIVTCAAHHDNYDCWDSKHHPWNSVKVGPGKDIVGEFAAATKAAGLRFGVTDHLERAWSWMQTNKGADSKGPFAGVPYDGNDPEFEDLYLPKHGDSSSAYPQAAPESWMRHWQARIMDVVDSYDPDLLYTDGAIPFGEIGLETLAHFYNGNTSRRGKFDAVYALKDHEHLAAHGYHGEYREGIGVLDVERGVVDGASALPWQTDTCIGEWYYKADAPYKSPAEIVAMLVDIVSKNGNLLLNFPLRPDGTLDAEEQWIAEQIGEWINVFGEGIYGTRPFDVYGEGPTQLGAGLFAERDKKTFTGEDIRFTRKGNLVYAFLMGWPAERVAAIKSLGHGRGPETIRSVELVGSDVACMWQRRQPELMVTLPERPVSPLVNVLRITVA